MRPPRRTGPAYGGRGLPGGGADRASATGGRKERGEDCWAKTSVRWEASFTRIGGRGAGG